MWISKGKYEELEHEAKDNEYDAKMFRSLIEYIKEKKTVFYCDFVLMSRDTWDKVSNKYNTSDDYELTIGTIEYYKNKACEYIKGKCDKCEAMYEYSGKQYCQFDTVIRFIKWDNQYNT